MKNNTINPKDTLAVCKITAVSDSRNAGDCSSIACKGLSDLSDGSLFPVSLNEGGGFMFTEYEIELKLKGTAVQCSRACEELLKMQKESSDKELVSYLEVNGYNKEYKEEYETVCIANFDHEIHSLARRLPPYAEAEVEISFRRGAFYIEIDGEVDEAAENLCREICRKYPDMNLDGIINEYIAGTGECIEYITVESKKGENRVSFTETYNYKREGTITDEELAQMIGEGQTAEPEGRQLFSWWH